MLGGDYYDLSTIPERFTGYSGPDAHRVWRSIYDENCFDISEQSLVNKITMHTPDTLVSRQTIEDAESDTCLEKKVYYKIVSGIYRTSSAASSIAHTPFRSTRVNINSHMQ